MVDASLFARSALLGLAMAAPVGPIGVLCISRTLAAGRRQGILTGLGVALADMVLAGFAVLGMTAIAAFLVQEQFWLRLVGGLFLIGLGARYVLRPPAATAEPATVDYAHLTLSGFALTFTNPLPVLGMAGLMAGLGIAHRVDGVADGILVMVGVAVGSMLWWVLLALAAGLMRRWVSRDGLRTVNRVLGALLALGGILVLVTLGR